MVIWYIVPIIFFSFSFSLCSRTCQFLFSLTVPLIPPFADFSVYPMSQICFLSFLHFHKLPSSQSEGENLLCVRNFLTSSVIYQHSSPQKVGYKFILERHFTSWMYSKNHSSVWWNIPYSRLACFSVLHISRYIFNYHIQKIVYT